MATVHAGDALTATDFAREMNRDCNAVNKHLKQLAGRGVLATRTGEDRRSTVFFLHESVRREPGWLNDPWGRFRIR